jgi:hypothetical protein
MFLLQGGVDVPPLRPVLRHGGHARGHQAEEPGDEETDDMLGRQEPAHREPSYLQGFGEATACSSGADACAMKKYGPPPAGATGTKYAPVFAVGAADPASFEECV